MVCYCLLYVFHIGIAIHFKGWSPFSHSLHLLFRKEVFNFKSLALIITHTRIENNGKRHFCFTHSLNTCHHWLSILLNWLNNWHDMTAILAIIGFLNKLLNGFELKQFSS